MSSRAPDAFRRGWQNKKDGTQISTDMHSAAFVNALIGDTDIALQRRSHPSGSSATSPWESYET